MSINQTTPLASCTESMANTSPSAPEVQASSMYKKPKQALVVVIKAGMTKSLLLWWQVLSLSWHAGMFIGFGAGLMVVVNGGLGSAKITGYAPAYDGSEISSGDVEMSLAIPSGIKVFVGGALFPVGLILVVLTGAELFTGNVMYLFAARMHNKITWISLLWNWILAYFGNLAGSLTVAYFLFHKTELLQDDLENPSPAQEYIYGIAEAKTPLHKWWPIFLKGIACNYLVCMSLWCASCADDVGSKMIALWAPIMCFVTIGFEHSVANMFFVPLAIMEGYDLSANSFISRNLLPVTLGNIVGGVAFILLQYVMYHPQMERIQDTNRSKLEVLEQEQSIFGTLYSLWLKYWPADFVSIQQTERVEGTVPCEDNDVPLDAKAVEMKGSPHTF